MSTLFAAKASLRSSLFSRLATARSTRIAIAMLLVVPLVVGRPSPARAEISGTTWTCIILCGGYAVYNVAKFEHDADQANAQGAAADQLMNFDWKRNDPTSSLRNLRVSIIDNIYILDAIRTKPKLPGYPPVTISESTWKGARAQFETLRTCWNALIYAGSKASDKSGSSDRSPKPASDKSSTFAASDNSAKSVSTKPSTSAASDKTDDTTCGFDPQNVAPYIDATDLKTAFSAGNSLYQQIIGLDMDHSYDYNVLRGEYLYSVATSVNQHLENLMTKGGGEAATSNVSGLTNCVTSLSTMSCISSIGALESVYAADVRHDVACDVATRAQLPMLTSINRILQQLPQKSEDGVLMAPKGPLAIDGNVEKPLEGPHFNFGAPPGC